MRIRREQSQDVQQIRAVTVAAFGADAEALIVDTLRSEAINVISLVAEDDGQIVGHVMFSPVHVAGAPDLRSMALAPLSVMPQRQRTGIGSALARAGLEECRRSGADAVFVVGHPEYYPRFGFSRASVFGFQCEFDVADDAFMVAELKPLALAGHSGTLHYHQAFRHG